MGNKRTIRFEKNEDTESELLSKTDANLRKRFRAPVMVSDPASISSTIPHHGDESEGPKSTSHRNLIDKLRERNSSIHKNILLRIGKNFSGLSPHLKDFQAKSIPKETLSFRTTKSISTQPSNPLIVSHEDITLPRRLPMKNNTPSVEWWDEKWYSNVPLSKGVDRIGDDYFKGNFPKCLYMTASEIIKECPQQVTVNGRGDLIKLPKELRAQRKKERAEKARKYRDGVHRGENIQRPPKLSMENIHGILKNKKMPNMDPIECEAIVVADQVTRRQNHEERNQKSKKTAEQKAAKRQAKLQRESSDFPRVLFFRLEALTGSDLIHRNPSYIKIILNIQQLHIFGVFLTVENKHFLLAECGCRAANKLKTLLIRRMAANLQCKLLHESEIHERQFTSFDAKEFADIKTAQIFFQDMNYPFLMEIA